MPREFLLALIALAVLLNLALIMAVVLARARQMPGGGQSRRRPSAITPSTPARSAEVPTVPEPVAAPVVRAPAATPAPARALNPRRSGRFVLPRLEEDHRRAERAIQAVLGESPVEPAHDGARHRPRRRSRRHRAPGEIEQTAIEMTLVGLDALGRAGGAAVAARMAGATSATVGATIRSGDRLIDLGYGRLRLVVQADAAGAGSAAERIGAMTAPWLEAAPVPLSLRLSVDAGGEHSPGPVPGA